MDDNTYNQPSIAPTTSFSWGQQQADPSYNPSGALPIQGANESSDSFQQRQWGFESAKKNNS